APLEQVADVAPLALGIAAAVGEDQAVAGLREHVLRPAHDVGEERTRHEADRLRAPADQAARDVARAEAERGDRPLDPGPRLRRDAALAVDHAGDRLMGNAGDAADVPDRRALASRWQRHGNTPGPASGRSMWRKGLCDRSQPSP